MITSLNLTAKRLALVGNILFLILFIRSALISAFRFTQTNVNLFQLYYLPQKSLRISRLLNTFVLSYLICKRRRNIRLRFLITYLPQQFLNFLPDPQGHGSFLPIEEVFTIGPLDSEFALPPDSTS